MQAGRKSITVPADTSEVASRPERFNLNPDSGVFDVVEVYVETTNTSPVWVGFEGTDSRPGEVAGKMLDGSGTEQFEREHSFRGVRLYDLWISGSTDGDGVTYNAY